MGIAGSREIVEESIILAALRAVERTTTAAPATRMLGVLAAVRLP